MITTGDDTAGDSEEITSNKEECTSCEENNVDNITEGITSVAILSDMSTCASCGKEGNSDNMNTCNKCKMVKYCNAACKKKHRKKHKKACEKRVAELHEEQLFKEHSPKEECPLCFLPLPLEIDQVTFETCCGKFICNGCLYATVMSESDGGVDLCAFCRMPNASSDEELVKRIKNLMDKGNAKAFNHLAGYYARGINGMPQDWEKSNELNIKAGELGCSDAYCNLGMAYIHGHGVEVDKEKATYYFELAAMRGNVEARGILGYMEYRAGNAERAVKHWILAAKAGHELCLDKVKKGYMNGLVTKDDYANIVRSYHDRQKEMKSDARERVAWAANEV